jgi:hypothetical protein
VILSHEGWEALRQHFSEHAAVIEIEAPMVTTPMPVHPHVPVSEFIWPRPRAGTMVTVLEPDLEGLRARSGMELPEVRPLDVVGGDVFADQPSFNTPGSLSPLRCPVCGSDGMHLLSAGEAEPVVRAFADARSLAFGHRPSERKGTRWQVAGQDLDAFRCPNCLSLAVNGPSAPSQIWPVDVGGA